MEPSSQHRFSRGRIVSICCSAGILIALFAFVPHIFSSTYVNLTTAEVTELVPTPEKPRVVHLDPPESVKTIYMSQCVVGTPNFREKLVTLVDETELNS